MSDKFKISGPARDVTEFIATAVPFTSSDSGAPEHHRYVLVKGDAEGLTCTASIPKKAIEVHAPDTIRIEEDGAMLAIGSSLVTVLRTIPADEEITMEVRDGDSGSHELHVTTNKNFNAVLRLPIFNEKTSIPRVTRVEDEEPNGFFIDANEMKAKFNRVAVSRDLVRRVVQLTGVLAKHEGGTLSFMTSNGKGTISKEDMATESVIGDGLPTTIFDVDLMATALDYATTGDKVSITTYPASSKDDAVQEVYFNVSDENDRTMYFIRTATIGIPESKYPVANLNKFLQTAAGVLEHYVTVNKNDLLEVLSQAAIVGAVDNQENVQGQQKCVSLSIDNDSLTVYVEAGSRRVYENAIALEEFSGSEEPIEFKLAYGIHGDALRLYECSENINIALVPSMSKNGPKRLANAFLLFHSDGKTVSGAEVGNSLDPDDLPVVLALFPLV